MRKIQYFLFVSKWWYICYYVICMTVPLNEQNAVKHINIKLIIIQTQRCIYTVAPMCHKFLSHFQLFNESFYFANFIFKRIKQLET